MTATSTVTPEVSTKVQEVLTHTDLDWTVSKKPIYFNTGNEDMPVMLKYDDKKAIVRDDNNAALGIIGDRYTIMQNPRLVEIAIEVANSIDFKVTKGGYMNDGNIVFLQLDYGKKLKVGPDKISRYLTLINSHDGSQSFKIGFGNQVMSCSNQFNYFSRKSNMTFRHSSGLHNAVADVLKKIQEIREEELALVESYQEFVNVDATDELVAKLMERLTGVDITMEEKMKQETYSTRKLNKVDDLLDAITNEMNNKGKTLWGAFNGITWYTNHEMTASKSDESSNKNLMFGGGYHLNKKAYDFALEQVS